MSPDSTPSVNARNAALQQTECPAKTRQNMWP